MKWEDSSSGQNLNFHSIVLWSLTFVEIYAEKWVKAIPLCFLLRAASFFLRALWPVSLSNSCIRGSDELEGWRDRQTGDMTYTSTVFLPSPHRSAHFRQSYSQQWYMCANNPCYT